MINWKDFTNIRIFKSIRMKPTAVIALENRDGTVSEVSVAELLSVDTGLKTQAAPAAKTTSTTLTAAEVIGGLLTANQGAAGAATYTMPLGTSLETALLALKPNLALDDSFDFSLVNISTDAAEDATIAANTGVTVVGNMVVASNAAATDESGGLFRVRRTAADTYVVYRIG